MATLGLKEFSHFLLLENAKKNLEFHFGVGRHASFPQKPVVNFLQGTVYIGFCTGH